MEEKDKQALQDWVNLALEKGYSVGDVKKTFKTYPKEVRKTVLKLFIQTKKGKKLKGGEIMKKKEFEEEEYEDEVEEEEEEEEVEEVEEKPKTPVQKKVPNNWFINYVPAKFQVIDPLKKKIMLEASSMEELTSLMQLKSFQRTYERL